MAAPANDSSRASVDPKAAVGVHSDVTDDVGVRVCIVGVGAPREFILHASTETSTASGNPDRGHSHPRQYDRNHRGTSRGRNSHRTRQKPPRDIQRGGTLIVHDRNHRGTSREEELSSYTTETTTGHPERGNSHPTQYDRNHHGTSRERELSSYTIRQKSPQVTHREISSYTTRQKPAGDTQREISSYTHGQKHPKENLILHTWTETISGHPEGTPILHNSTKNTTRNPEKGNSHPTHLDRNHHGAHRGNSRPTHLDKNHPGAHRGNCHPTQLDRSHHGKHRGPSHPIHLQRNHPGKPREGVLARILRNLPASLTGISVYLGGRSAGERANYGYEADSHHPGFPGAAP